MGADLLIKLGIATGLGLVMGLEREFSKPHEKTFMAGFRTFPLITLFGFITSFFSDIYSWYVFLAGFIGILTLVLVAKAFMARQGNVGTTTGSAVFISYFIGALVHLDFTLLAVTLAVIVTFLLSLKLQFQNIAGNFTQQDIYALLQFIVISGIILPVLPDRTIGPYEILNPREIWYMVVLITGLSFTGYLFSKFIGTEKGILITSIVGSLASTTAVTWDYSSKSSKNPHLSNNYSVGIMTGSSIMYMRVLLVAWVINSNFAVHLVIPLAMLSVISLTSGFLIHKLRKNTAGNSELKLANPLDLVTAFKFALLFGATLFLVNMAEKWLGESGVYIISAISGSTDVDPVSISIAKMAGAKISIITGAKAVVLATLSNTLVKYIMCIMFGSAQLRLMTTYGFGSVLAAGLIYLALV